MRISRMTSELIRLIPILFFNFPISVHLMERTFMPLSLLPFISLPTGPTPTTPIPTPLSHRYSYSQPYEPMRERCEPIPTSFPIVRTAHINVITSLYIPTINRLRAIPCIRLIIRSHPYSVLQIKPTHYPYHFRTTLNFPFKSDYPNLLSRYVQHSSSISPTAPYCIRIPFYGTIIP